MKPYILKEKYTEKLDKLIDANKAKPLIEELFYQYGLKVMEYTVLARVSYGKDYSHVLAQHPDEDLLDKNNLVTGFILTLDGLPYACVYVAEEIKPTYCYYSVAYSKQRAKFGNVDRGTLRSIHINTLVKNIEKHNAISTDDIIVNEIHAGLFPSLRELYYLPKDFYMIGNSVPYDKNNLDMHGFTIGKIRCSMKHDGRVREITELFQYVNSIDEYEHKADLIPKTTILKVDLDSIGCIRHNIFMCKGGKRVIPFESNCIVTEPSITLSPLSWAWTFIPVN